MLTDTPPEQATAVLPDPTPWCLGCGNQTARNAFGNIVCCEPTCPSFWLSIEEPEYYVPEDPSLLTGCEGCE